MMRMTSSSVSSTTTAMMQLVILIAMIGTVSGQIRGLCTTASGRAGQCRPLVKCVRFFHEIPSLQSRPCPLSTGERGVCCPHIVIGTATMGNGQYDRDPLNLVESSQLHRQHQQNQYHYPVHQRLYYLHRTPHFYDKYFIYYYSRQKAEYYSPTVAGSNRGSRRVLRRPPPPPVPVPQISRAEIDAAAQRAQQRRQRRRNITQRLVNAGLIVNNNVQTGGGQERKALPVSNYSFQLTPLQGTHALPVFSLVGTSLEVNQNSNEDNLCSSQTTQDTLKCSTADLKFRTHDGSCNNQQNPHWGQANIALQRLLDPKYEDGISLPRGQTSPDGSSRLPSPRSISATLIADENRPSQEYTLLLMQWGQFLDHDITHTPMVEDEDGFQMLCCSNGRPLQGDLRHPECLPIDIPTDDAFYSRFGQQCMEFVRSTSARNSQCNLGPREQVNQITGFLDGSNVYGSNLAEARKLRLGRGGRMRVTKFNDEELLPLNPDECADHTRRQYCFAAGDSRCNEQPQLTAMHTLWLREHNRIANQLALINPHWDDERLFQESRKIVGAEMQHITYNEWLPIILGMDYMDENNLLPKKEGMSQDYDPGIEPSVTNAFAASAFRFGHSLVQGSMERIDVFGNIAKFLQLHRHQQEPFEIYDGDAVDGLLRGLTKQPAQDLDASFTKELTERLFEEDNSGHGMDLVALNIQRGRDHGLPPYVEYRRLCKLPEIRQWRDLVNEVANPELVPRIQLLYKSVDEIDLFVGGIIERKAPGALLGPTFRCLVGDQFKRLKWGDRFWYEEAGQPNSFTQAQVDAIRESSIARIICDNGEAINQVQPLAFKVAVGMNSATSCNSDRAIPRVNLEAWKEF